MSESPGFLNTSLCFVTVRYTVIENSCLLGGNGVEDSGLLVWRHKNAVMCELHPKGTVVAAMLVGMA